MNIETSEIRLDSTHLLRCCKLPAQLCRDQADFNKLWQLHPRDPPRIFIHGRRVALPRWQQAYGRDYVFSGKTSKAQPIPAILQPYLSWAQNNLDMRINGLLLNWYEGQLGHYIGAHRDSTAGLVDASSIFMISLGGSRLLRLRPIKQSGYLDLEINHGDVIIMPLSTNQHYKHEVPGLKRHRDRRISITMRCFETERARPRPG